MKRNMQKWLSSLLTVAMIMTMLPTAVLATGETEVDIGSADAGTMSLVNQAAQSMDESESDDSNSIVTFALFSATTSDDVIGTGNNPFKIGSASVLEELSTLVNANADYFGFKYADASYVMTADIALSGDWTAINKFEGIFDGDGYAITGLSVDADSAWQGLFGYSTGTIQNVTVYGSIVSTNHAVGGIVGTSEGTVENCAFIGDISATYDVGGIVGNNKGTVGNCYSVAYISCSSDDNGGIVGENSRGTVENCVALGETVIGSDTVYAKRVVGYDIAGTLSNNYAWSGMTVGTTGSNGTTTGSANDKNGADLIYSNGSFNVTWSDIYSGWTGDSDELPNGDALPSYITDPSASTDEGWDGSAATDFAEENEISSAAELKLFANQVNAGTITEGTYTLTADIDLNGVEWTPIGTSSKSFSATFDGDDFTISGLYINQSETAYQGLFGYVNGGTVKDVNVVGSVSGKSNVGGVVGCNQDGTVSGCSFAGSVTGSNVYVGGVVGYNCANIESSTAIVENCYNTATVNGTSQVGGVVGYNAATDASATATVKNVYNTGAVTGSSSNVGGVVGENYKDGYNATATVQYAYNTGNVTGTSQVGGVIGFAKGTYEYLVSLANKITGTGTSSVGRVVGERDGSDLTNIYAWSGTNYGNATFTGVNGADLYYSSTTGFSETWETMGFTTANGWTLPTDSAYLPTLMGEVSQNPLSNLQSVTVTLDYGTEDVDDETISIEYGETLSADQIPAGTWKNGDDTLSTETIITADITYTLEDDSAILDTCPCGETHGIDGSWYPIMSATDFDSLVDGRNYYLLKDIDTTATFTINKTINLCLNGKTIERSTESSTDFSIITIVENGTLNLYDGTGTGAITGGNGTSVGSTPTNRGGGVLLYNTGEDGTIPTMNLYGGSITDNNATEGGGVYLFGACEFNMYGGSITDNRADLGGGVYFGTASTFTMTDGIISGNYAYDEEGGGVYAGGIFNMSGGTITDNYAGESGDDLGLGGGVFTGSSSTFTMSGTAIITGNTAYNYGGGVYATGTFKMENGTISDNISADGAGGVYLKGAMTMTDGTISDNIATGEGGGMYINDASAEFTMSGGLIDNNEAGDGGGGVYIDKGGEFTMTAGTISNNTADNTESGNGSTGALNDGNGGGIYISAGTFNMSGGSIEYNEAISEVTEGMEGNYEAINATNGNGGGVYVNYGDESGDNAIRAEFTMTGGTISNNTAEYKGGGVYVYDQFTLDGTAATITNNTAVYGGGVYINNAATEITSNQAEFMMYQGSITDNTATDKGGAVYGNTGSLFAIDNGTITGNSAGTGDGVYVVGTMYARGTINIQEVYLTSGTVINVAGELVDSSIIPVVTSQTPTAESSVKIATGTYAYTANFSAVRSYAEVVEDNDEIYLALIENDNYYSIGGTVTSDGSNPVEGTTVTLVQGNELLDSTTSASNGSYSFSYVVAGTYNVVATKDTTITTLVTITDGNQENVDITMPTYSSGLTVQGEDTPNVVVGGLDEVSNTASIVLTVESKEEDVADNATEIKAVAGSQTLEYLAITLKDDGGTDLGDSNSKVLEIIVPYDFTSKKNVTVYRYHGDSAEAFVETDTKLDGTYILDETNGYIYIYTSKFSTYAVGYDVVITTSGTSTYSSTVAIADNGTVSLSSTKSTMGSTVTITTTPDDGYEVGTVTVTYASGREVTVTDNGDGTYSYKQPGATVTVTVTFVATDSEWYTDALNWATDEGVVDADFDGTGGSTRADAVYYIWMAMGSPESTMENPFTDISEDDWYYEAVIWAVEAGVTTGTDDGTTFSPDWICNRSQIVTLLWRNAGQPVVNYLMTFSDVASDTWYSEAVRWAVSETITQGTGDDTFSPNTDCSRLEILTFLYRSISE